jgi:hypothetical protein
MKVHQRQHQQRRRPQQQRHHVSDPLTAEQEAQLAEGRRRMAEEGETRDSSREPQLGAALGRKP